MTTEHPITPTPKLVAQWLTEVADLKLLTPTSLDYLATQAARWGADQELEACVKWLKAHVPNSYVQRFRAARRPKPPSLKEQALEALDRMDLLPTAEDQHIIRRALEQLQELENNG